LLAKRPVQAPHNCGTPTQINAASATLGV